MAEVVEVVGDRLEMMTVLLVMLGKISRVLMMLICRNYLYFKSL